MMEAKEVFEAVCGRDEVGDNRALVRVQVGIVDRTTMEEEPGLRGLTLGLRISKIRTFVVYRI